MRQQWVQIFKNKGVALLRDEAIIKKSFRCVEDLLEFKKKSEALMQRVFSDKESIEMFKNTVKEAFDYFLNIDSNKTSEFLAKFLDYHLKKSSG